MGRLSAVLVLLVVCAGCSGGGGGSGGGFAGLPSGDVQLGGPIDWSVRAPVNSAVRMTVTDDKNNIVWASGFEVANRFRWQPVRSGTYHFLQEIRAERGTLSASSTSTLRITQGDVSPAVMPTAHPLTAGYVLNVASGVEARVSYTCTTCSATAKTFVTPPIIGTGAQEFILLAGLRPNATYEVHHELRESGVLTETGPSLSYATGALPIAELAVTVTKPSPNPLQNALLALAAIPGTDPASSIPWIVDETGTPVWYLNKPSIITRPTGQGWGVLIGFNAVEVVDYTGTTTRRLTAHEANDQLAAMSLPQITGFHHEFKPLPGGRWALFGVDERFVTDLQGPGNVDVLGDVVLVVNDAMQIVWTWNSFDHLDISRLANPNFVCHADIPGCPPLLHADAANDWTHSNAIDYDPADGNLIVSIRHQSWIVKIRYEDGKGDGGIVWRLGPDGDFTINSSDPFPWFSFQHDPNILADGSLAVYDNGNRRRAELGSGNSRGQVYALNETTMTAEHLVNVDLGVFSAALGSAAMAPDGSYHFNSGFLIDSVTGEFHAIHDDIAADGTLVSRFETPTAGVYRSFRMSDPYDTRSN